MLATLMFSLGDIMLSVEGCPFLMLFQGFPGPSLGALSQKFAGQGWDQQL